MPVVTVENMQEFYSETIEYYDELYPLDPSVSAFIAKLARETTPIQPGGAVPLCRYLGIGCATGNLENGLAQAGFDITGIDLNPDMIETAKRRMKRGGSTIRFFEMGTIDMRRFLKAGSFNVITCLDNMLPYIGDETLTRKFFHDAKTLLAAGGTLVMQVINIDSFGKGKTIKLQERSSVRVTLTETWTPSDDGKYSLDASLELGNGKRLILKKGTGIFACPADQLEGYAREAGFTSCERHADFSGTAWSPESVNSVLLFR
jgi:2-polyprenyl-3-methyl-5-hydroxy-6-metoxy-1,4-benzoquinol methylase